MALNEQQAARLAELEAMAAPGFKEKQEMVKLRKLAGEGATVPAPPPAEEESGPAEAPAPAEVKAPAPAAAPKAAKPKAPKAVEGGVFVEALGERFEVPATFPGYAALVRVAEAQRALNAALAGEG